MRRSANQRVSTDRYGNPYVLKRMKAKVDRKSGEHLPVFVGYVEIGGNTYQVEVSNNNKEYNDGKESKWMKVRKMQPRRKSSF